MSRSAVRRAVIVAVAFAFFLPFNCTSPRTLGDGIIYGGTYDARERIRDAVIVLELPVWRAVRSIHITDYCPHYLPRDNDGRPQESGHCKSTRDICIRPSCVYDVVVWHECGHAFLMSRSYFERLRWSRVSSSAYGNRDGEFPRDGILTAYGAKDAHEDFAEWVRWAMEYLYHSPFSAAHVDLSKIDVTDTRYIQHLDFLRDWGAISHAQYAVLAPLFTPDSK